LKKNKETIKMTIKKDFACDWFNDIFKNKNVFIGRKTQTSKFVMTSELCKVVIVGDGAVGKNYKH
jgi:hypothetical protein